MIKIVLAAVALLFAGTAQARMPVLAATCPGNVKVDTNAKGEIFINGKKAKVKKGDANHYHATGKGITVWISWPENSAPDVSYTGKDKSNNGVCEITATE